MTNKASDTSSVWYFDFISPYAYLQSQHLHRFGDDAQITLKPILFAGLLKHWGQLGPAEIVPKRDWTFEQVVWHAHAHNIPLTLPPAHPFNPLPFLRLAIACGCNTASVQKIFRFIWAQGHAYEDTDAFDGLLNGLGKTRMDLDATDVKNRLRANTDEAIANQVFGVPTLAVFGHKSLPKLFWGFDSTDLALSYLANDPFWRSDQLQRAQTLPYGQQRKV